MTEAQHMASSIDPTAYDTAAFDRGISPVIQMLSPQQAQQLVEYRGDEWLRRRIDELASKSNEGLLTTQEKAEYEGYVRANKFVAILQAQAKKLFNGPPQG
jgi:hypothetical protein